MTKKLQMYQVLEEMIENIEINPDRLLELNLKYNSLTPGIYSGRAPTSWESDYDACMQSCVLAYQLPHARALLIEDARKKFSKISKPNR